MKTLTPPGGSGKSDSFCSLKRKDHPCIVCPCDNSIGQCDLSAYDAAKNDTKENVASSKSIATISDLFHNQTK